MLEYSRLSIINKHPKFLAAFSLLNDPHMLMRFSCIVSVLNASEVCSPSFIIWFVGSLILSYTNQNSLSWNRLLSIESNASSSSELVRIGSGYYFIYPEGVLNVHACRNRKCFTFLDISVSASVLLVYNLCNDFIWESESGSFHSIDVLKPFLLCCCESE